MSDDQAHQHQHQHQHPPIGGSAECTLCPVCVVLQAISASRPEVMEHLQAAGRELTLALQAVLEQQADAQAAGRDRIQRIDVDEE